MELYRAAHEVGLDPCLIGAGAIQLGGEFGWRIRLDRNRLNAFRLGILDR